MTSGETWTRKVLAELRASGFTPAAWLRFLAQSLARAREPRAERPREHQVVVALGAAGIAAWALAAVWGQPWLAATGAAWWALQAAMIDWHLGLLERPDGSRLDRLGTANLLTILRGGLTPAVLALAGSSAGLALFLLTGVMDVVDGRLARRRDETTLLGAWLDGTIDTLVVGAATLGAAVHGLLPAWAASLVLLRLAAPWALAAASYFGRGERPQLDDASAGRPAALAAGAVVFAGLALALLHLPGAAVLTGIGAAAGMIVLSHRVSLAAPLTTKGEDASGRRSAANATRSSC